MEFLPGEEPEKILMVLASKDFNDDEYLISRAAFEEAGYQVVVCSSVPGRIRGAAGTWVIVDQLIYEVRAHGFAALVFVGGDGASEYFGSKVAHRLAAEAEASAVVIGAICVAPSILAEAGMLEMRRATCHASRREHLIACGVVLVDEPVVSSEWIVTASGPAVSKRFAAAVLELIVRRK